MTNHLGDGRNLGRSNSKDGTSPQAGVLNSLVTSVGIPHIAPTSLSDTQMHTTRLPSPQENTFKLTG